MQNPLRPHHRLQLQSTLVPTRRQRAVSAAVVAPPSLVHSNRPLQLLPLLRTSPPQQSDQSGWNAEQPPLPTNVSSSLPLQATAICTHAPMRRAVPPTALWGRLLLRRSQRPQPSRSGRGRCLCSAHPGRACTCTPPHRVAHARSIDSIAASTRLLSAARRRGVR